MLKLSTTLQISESGRHVVKIVRANKTRKHLMVRQKGIDLNHDFYVVVGNQCRTENAYTGHQHIIVI